MNHFLSQNLDKDLNFLIVVHKSMTARQFNLKFKKFALKGYSFLDYYYLLFLFRFGGNIEILLSYASHI